MNLTTLLNMLLAIERGIGTESDAAIRTKIQDVESYVLEMQKEKASKLLSELRHHAVLRENCLMTSRSHAASKSAL